MQFPQITNIMFSLFKPVGKDTRKTGCRGVLSFKYPISKANFKFELKFFFLTARVVFRQCIRTLAHLRRGVN